MNYFELTKKRCCYRGKFTTKKVPRGDIELVLTAAMNAPSGCNAQSTQYVVVDDSELIQQIGRVLGKSFVYESSFLIICIVNAEPETVIADMSFEVEDCSAAVMSMLLAITELGYASVWLDGVLRYDDNAQKIADIIKLPQSKKIQIILPVGEPADEMCQPPKMSIDERVSFNKYSL